MALTAQLEYAVARRLCLFLFLVVSRCEKKMNQNIIVAVDHSAQSENSVKC